MRPRVGESGALVRCGACSVMSDSPAFRFGDKRARSIARGRGSLLSVLSPAVSGRYGSARICGSFRMNSGKRLRRDERPSIPRRSSAAPDDFADEMPRCRPHSGFLRCGCCGGAITIVAGGCGSPRYGCSRRSKNGPSSCANHLTIRAKVADGVLLGELQANCCGRRRSPTSLNASRRLLMLRPISDRRAAQNASAHERTPTSS